MAHHRPPRDHGWPLSVLTLGAMVEQSAQVQVSCTVCREYHRFTTDELAALAEKVGREFSLINRRTRCRLTAGCEGWNRFYHKQGVYRPLWDSANTWRM